MPIFEHIGRIHASQPEVWNWYNSPGAFRRIMPEWEKITPLQAGALRDGEVTKFKVKIGPIRRLWIAKHSDVIEGQQFRDTMVKGPFGAWNHLHSFNAVDEDMCNVVDQVNWKLPLHPLTFWTAPFTVNGRTRQMFDFRTRRVASDLKRIRQYASIGSKRILISGSTGLIGTQLCAFLQAAGHHIVRLVRPSTVLPADSKNDETIVWNDSTGEILNGDLNGFDAVIHLAGAGIGDKRWNARRKQVIRESRTIPTRHLTRLIGELDHPPAVFISGSAIGFYGNRGDEVLDESSSIGAGLLSEICQEWEDSSRSIENTPTRLVYARTGIVTTPMGGALAKLLLPASLNAGGPVGGGKQYYSWISLDDQIYAIYHLLMNDECMGVYNLTAPEPVTQKVYAKTMGKVMKRLAFAPLPGFVLKLMLGEMAQALVLDGQRVLPRRLLDSGFEFEHSTLEDCLRHCLGKVRL